MRLEWTWRRITHDPFHTQKLGALLLISAKSKATTGRIQLLEPTKVVAGRVVAHHYTSSISTAARMIAADRRTPAIALGLASQVARRIHGISLPSSRPRTFANQPLSTAFSCRPYTYLRVPTYIDSMDPISPFPNLPVATVDLFRRH